MKRRWLLFIAAFVLGACLLPQEEALALEPREGGDAVWVLTDVVCGTPDETTETEQAMAGVSNKFKVVLKESIFEFHIQTVKSGQTLADAHFTFNYDVPPETLIPGETVQLASSGKAEGFVGTAKRQFSYQASQRNDDDSLVTSLGDKRYELNSEHTQRSIMLQFVVPEASGGKLWIQPRLSTSEPFHILWVYEPGEAGPTGAATAATSTTSSTGDDRPAWQKRAERYVTESGAVIHVPPWLQWLKPKELTQQRGTVIEPKGEVWVYDNAFGNWRGPLKADTKIHSGDRIRTGPKSMCRMVFTNKEGQQDVISIGSDTLMESPTAVQESPYPALWSLYEGAISIKRALMRETPEVEENPFIVRTPTIAGGTRGSLPDFNGAYCAVDDPGVILAGAQPEPWLSIPAGPATGEEWTVTGEFIISADGSSASVYVISGELDYYSSQPDGSGNAALFVAAGGPKESIISAGQKLTLTDIGTVSVAAFTASELNSLIMQEGLKSPELICEQDVQALLTDDTDSSGSNILIPVIAGVAVVIGAGVIIRMMLARKKAR